MLLDFQTAALLGEVALATVLSIATLIHANGR